ncbi:MAG TPA: FUSC family protein [Paraburkholderia sp.]
MIIRASIGDIRNWRSHHCLGGLELWIGVFVAGSSCYRDFQSYGFVLSGYAARVTATRRIHQGDFCKPNSRHPCLRPQERHAPLQKRIARRLWCTRKPRVLI